MRVKVYRNLHKRCWSIMDPKTRRVIDHRHDVALSNVSLVVSQAGRERVIREKAKNVHAYAIGDMVDSVPEDIHMVEASYNPYRFSYFFEKETFKPRSDAAFAALMPDGRLYASA